MKTRDVMYYNGSRNPVPIAQQIGQVIEYVEDVRPNWGGTPTEYRSWAIETVQGAMEEIAKSLCSHVPDGDIGINIRRHVAFLAGRRL